MKIQCNACEAAEASVLCCADEAALCWACDEKVHAANKLASKHQRIPLTNSSMQMPKCDICQETVGFFFCLEDRALLCRKCDVAIHTANPYVSKHQRFLLTGVRVGLEPKNPDAPSMKEKSNSVEETVTVPRTVSRRGSTASVTGETNGVLSGQASGGKGPTMSKMSFSGGTTTGSIPEWPLDEFLGLTDFNHNFGFMEHGSSKADSGRLGDSDWSPILRAADEDLGVDECLNQDPGVSLMVPEIPSPPTASGLYWPKTLHNAQFDSGLFVPDVGCLPVRNHGQHLLDARVPECRRQY
ncbi:B-box zinc finger protein 22-like isoform X1 [Macadamia integrifolia]|uniref:B-box zinc finger protein 22-like isoform X1 n=1 Tax=Macadamia integrifolia TaxID=60698 RepID=UPI001C527F8F|nr:B-box zinc finger protein 22-like isoform X1 [Macadamia integrifolia]